MESVAGQVLGVGFELLVYNKIAVFFLKPKTYNLKTAGGQAVLAPVLIIGSIVMLLGVTLTFLANSLINITGGFQAAEQAQSVAFSGVYDALMRLSRAKGFYGAYVVPINDWSANVAVVQDFPSVGLVEITSDAVASRRRREVRAIVSRNSINGAISLVSWELQ